RHDAVGLDLGRAGRTRLLVLLVDGLTHGRDAAPQDLLRDRLLLLGQRRQHLVAVRPPGPQALRLRAGLGLRAGRPLATGRPGGALGSPRGRTALGRALAAARPIGTLAAGAAGIAPSLRTITPFAALTSIARWTAAFTSATTSGSERRGDELLVARGTDELE